MNHKPMMQLGGGKKPAHTRGNSHALNPGPVGALTQTFDGRVKAHNQQPEFQGFMSQSFDQKAKAEMLAALMNGE